MKQLGVLRYSHLSLVCVAILALLAIGCTDSEQETPRGDPEEADVHAQSDHKEALLAANLPVICTMSEQDLKKNLQVDKTTSFAQQVETHGAILSALVMELARFTAAKSEALAASNEDEYGKANACVGRVEFYLGEYLAANTFADERIEAGYKFREASMYDDTPLTGEICRGDDCIPDVDPIFILFFFIAGEVVDCLNSGDCPSPAPLPETNNDLVKAFRKTYPVNPAWWAGALAAGDRNDEVSRLLRDPAGRLIEIRDNWMSKVDSDCSGEICKAIENPGKRTEEILKNWRDKTEKQLKRSEDDVKEFFKGLDPKNW